MIKRLYTCIKQVIYKSIINLYNFENKIKNRQAGLNYGEKSAAIEVINYTSFQCSDCVVIHEKLHNVIKKYIMSGKIKFIEKPINITRFQYDDIIYKHMNKEQSLDFDKLLNIYSTQNKWIEFDSNEKVIQFLNLSPKQNSKTIRDLKVITDEKVKIGLKEVPTMYMNGERIPLDITVEEFENKIQSLLKAD